mgnify:CR=1 FL=1
MRRDTRSTRLLLVLLVLTALTVITLDYQRGGGAVGGLRTAVGAVVGPVQRAASAVVRPVSSFLSTVASADRQQARVRALEQEVERLRWANRTSELARHRAAELDSLLHLAGAGRYRVVPAQVVGLGRAQDFSWTATLDAGRRDGISEDMTVVNGDGLVGRVTHTGPWTSTILLAADPDFAVGVRLERTMDIGYVKGAGEGPAQLSLLGAQAKVTVGDRLVTLGSVGGRPFVPGVPVGRVVSVDAQPGSPTKQASVAPYVDFSRLDLVGVVIEPPRRDPRDALLPPRPPAPRASSAPSAGTPTTSVTPAGRRGPTAASGAG